MRGSSRPHDRRLLVGGIKVFLADVLIIPSGILTAAYLGRRLGPEGYGIFTVAAALVAWVEWSLTGLFARASIKVVADARDWRPVGSTVVSAHLGLSLAATVLLVALAGPVAAALSTPELAGPLRLFALDIPLFCLAQAHRHILVGIGDFAERAGAAAARWISRLLLVVLLVELGLSIDGAVLGSIGASLVEVAVCRWFVRPGFSARAALEVGKLWGYVAPLFISALALRLYDRLDLVALTALGGSAEAAGHYGAAQNLALLPGILGLSFTPLLLTTLTRAFRDGDAVRASRLGRDAMRGAFLLAPFTALCAGSAAGIVDLVFGPAFAQAAGLVAPLMFSGVALVLVSVGTAILTARGRPGLTAACTAPIPLAAAGGYLALIPGYGPRGAALVTLVVSCAAALGLLMAVHRVCRIAPPAGSVVKAVFLGAAAYLAAARWPAAGALVLLQLGLVGGAILLVYRLTGELASPALPSAAEGD
ncbi:MAG TPA: oligosaccharide flippase family protein [Gemmatimonadales bacterium]|nr:oligosaccharide flippase family protein [Gemmatimonadales bacterium]